MLSKKVFDSLKTDSERADQLIRHMLIEHSLENKNKEMFNGLVKDDWQNTFIVDDRHEELQPREYSPCRKIVNVNKSEHIDSTVWDEAIMKARLLLENGIIERVSYEHVFNLYQSILEEKAMMEEGLYEDVDWDYDGDCDYYSEDMDYEVDDWELDDEDDDNFNLDWKNACD